MYSKHENKIEFTKDERIMNKAQSDLLEILEKLKDEERKRRDVIASTRR